MNTVRIPAKKAMKPGISLMDIENIWDYIDLYVEEEEGKMFGNNDASFFGDEDEYDDDFDSDDSWEDNEWGADYLDDYEDYDYARDTWDAITDGMYGDMPDGFDGDYSFMGR